MSTPCYICEAPMDEIRVDEDLRPKPCSRCLTAIQECVAEYDQEVEEDSEDKEEHITLDEFLERFKK